MPGGARYEPKWDGFRLLMFVDEDVTLWSRQGKNLTHGFPELVAAAADQLPLGVILDGEAVVWSEDRLDFDALLRRLNAGSSTRARMVRELPASYVAFDLLAVAGQDTRGLRLDDRRALLEELAGSWEPPLNLSENAVMVSGTVHMGTPKSHHARSVPVPRFLARDLRTIARLRRPDEFLFGDGAEPMRLPNSKSGWFAAAVKRTMAEDRSFPYVSPHDLRHTAASLAISAGANVKAVQRMLGHASAAMTLDTYSDLFDDDLDAVSEALDRARSQSMDIGPWSPPQTGSSSGLRM